VAREVGSGWTGEWMGVWVVRWVDDWGAIETGCDLVRFVFQRMVLRL
jgi:hypothetical protein